MNRNRKGWFRLASATVAPWVTLWLIYFSVNVIDARSARKEEHSAEQEVLMLERLRDGPADQNSDRYYLQQNILNAQNRVATIQLARRGFEANQQWAVKMGVLPPVFAFLVLLVGLWVWRGFHPTN